MKKKLDTALHIVKTLSAAGHRALFAGGWVRDHIMCIASDDIDIATSAKPEDIIKLFDKTIAVGMSFGVVIVVIDGISFEVSTFRSESGYIDGRHPEHICFTTAEEDAKRRDFTINGMFYDPIEDIIYDFVAGRDDIKHKIVRCIGSPIERFTDDKLRMLRAIRFACRFGFTIAPTTAKAIKNLSSHLLPAVSMERIWQEFVKMIKYGNFVEGLKLMNDFGLWKTIFRNCLLDLAKVEKLSLLPKDTPEIVYIKSITPLSPDDLFTYFKLSKDDLCIAELYVKALDMIGRKKVDNIEWAHFFAKPRSLECVRAALIMLSIPINFYDALYNALTPSINRIITKRPVVTSTMLKQHGVEPGKNMGSLLSMAESIAINNHIDDAERVIKLMQNDGLL